MSGFGKALAWGVNPLGSVMRTMAGGKNNWLWAISPALGALSGDTKAGNAKPGAAPQLLESPKAGEDTTLKPGQKTNLISTSPQGVLSPATSNRATLLGG